MDESTHEQTPGQTPEAPDDEIWDDELIPDHEYDGIHEYDNPIPGWLSLLFIGTIVWSIVYLIAIGLGFVQTYEESYQANVREIQRQRNQASAGESQLDQSTLQEIAGKEKRIKEGRAIFDEKCATCHGDAGGGQVGPNLTDDHWVKGGRLIDIYKTVKNGTQGGMPKWGDDYPNDKLASVVAYVRSIRGSEPEGAKPPEGEKFVPKK